GADFACALARRTRHLLHALQAFDRVQLRTVRPFGPRAALGTLGLGSALAALGPGSTLTTVGTQGLHAVGRRAERRVDLLPLRLLGLGDLQLGFQEGERAVDVPHREAG